MSRRREIIDLEMTLKQTTERAILVTDGKKDVWLPLSLVEVETKPGGMAIVTCPEWLAVKEEIDGCAV